MSLERMENMGQTKEGRFSFSSAVGDVFFEPRAKTWGE